MNAITRAIGSGVLGLAVCCTPTKAQTSPLPADTLLVTLSSAVERALDASPEIGAVTTKRDYADARLRYAKAFRFLASFEATTAHAAAPGLKNDDGIPRDELYLHPEVRNDWDSVSPFNRLDIELTQPIFTWGEIAGNVRAAEHGVAYEEESVRAKGLEVALRTGQLYYGLLLAKALTTLAQSAEDLVTRAIEEIESQLDSGASEVDDADLFQVQIAEQEVKRRVVEVEQTLLTTRAALARQMMLPDGVVPDVGDRVLSVTPFELKELAYYQELALANRPEIGQVEAGLAAREELVGVARSDYYPKLFAAANVKYSYAADRYRQRNPYISDAFLSSGLEAGIGFRQKLNFSQTRAKVEQARSEAAEVRFQGEVANQLILFEVEQAYRDVIIARSAVETGDAALLLSKNWLHSEEINFDLDLGDTENLVRAVQSNLELQAVQNQAVHDYNVAVLSLLSKTGTLSQTVRNGIFVE